MQSATDPGAVLLAPLEGLINRGIQASTTAAGLAASLEGRSLALCVSGTPFRLTLRSQGGRLQLCPGDDPAADVRIRGAPLGLMALLRNDAQDPLRSGQAVLQGDTDLAERFRALLVAASPDLEEQIARLFGDAAAHQLGRLAREAAEWAEVAAVSLGRNLGEYLREERRILPARAEVQRWLAEVDVLRSDVDRAAARMERLLRQRRGGEPG